jgi:hypothetical protein
MSMGIIKIFHFSNKFHSNNIKPSATEENQENTSNNSWYQLRFKQGPTAQKINAPPFGQTCSTTVFFLQ